MAGPLTIQHHMAIDANHRGKFDRVDLFRIIELVDHESERLCVGFGRLLRPNLRFAAIHFRDHQHRVDFYFW